MKKPLLTSRQRHIWLALEFIAFFIAVPVIFYFHANRWNMHVALWLVSLYALFHLHRTSDFSWKQLWHGKGWSWAQKKIAILRFLISVPLIIGFTYYMVPERLFSFPMQRPGFWLVVMVLYPILSVLPQELLFRSFFFHRYKPLFDTNNKMIVASAGAFAFVHIVFHNWISPLFCMVGGLMFAHSFQQHRSLKWSVIEHAAYGCLVFTVGIGLYFYFGGVTALTNFTESFVLRPLDAYTPPHGKARYKTNVNE